MIDGEGRLERSRRWIAALPFAIAVATVVLFVGLHLVLDVSIPAPRTATVASAAATIDAAGTAAIWRGAVAGLLVCAAAYVVNALVGFARFGPRGDGRTPLLLVTVGIGAWLAGLVWTMTAGHTDLRLDVLERATPAHRDAVGWTIRAQWTTAALMVWCAVCASTAVIAARPSLPGPTTGADHPGDTEFTERLLAACHELARRHRWLRRTLLVGTVGPILGIVAVIALNAHAATFARSEEVAASIHAYGRAVAIELGIVLSFLQIAVYVPPALRFSAIARVLAERGRGLPPPGVETTDHVDAWLRECGIERRGTLERTARALAVMSPLIVALSSSSLALPVG